MSRCIVNVATGHYTVGQLRLFRALRDGADKSSAVMLWRDKMPPSSPQHSYVPYAFKAWALHAAANAGYTSLLWADACIVPSRSLDALWDLIEVQGYWFSDNGWVNGQWCCDQALSALGVTREETFRQKHVVATAFGLDLRHCIAQEFLNEYLRFAQNGAFIGPWKNENGEASSDKRVLGHRHDQTAASVLVDRLSMRLTNPPDWFAYKGGETDSTVLVADGGY